MRGRKRWLLVGLVLVGSGCHAVAPERRETGGVVRMTRLFSMKEAMCLHCNCLMPAGIALEAMCPVCKCGKRARACVR